MKNLYPCQVESYRDPSIEERDALLDLQFHLPDQSRIITQDAHPPTAELFSKDIPKSSV